MQKSVLLLASIALSVLLACGVALAAVEGSASGERKIAFVSGRTMGEGVDNPEGDLEIFTINPDGTGLQQITKNTTDEFGIAVSLDGAQVAFLERDSQVNRNIIYRMNLDGSGKRRIGIGHDPAWSPDGRWIAFTKRSNRQVDIYKMRALKGSDKTNLSNTPGVSESDPTWSPTGFRIAYTRSREIYDMRYDGSMQTKLTDTPNLREENPDYKPDGRRIAFTTFELENEEPVEYERWYLYTMPADGSRPASRIYYVFYPTTLSNPDWSPDGSQIAFSLLSFKRGGDESDIAKINADGTGPENITNSPTEAEGPPDWYKAGS